MKKLLLMVLVAIATVSCTTPEMEKQSSTYRLRISDIESDGVINKHFIAMYTRSDGQTVQYVDMVDGDIVFSYVDDSKPITIYAGLDKDKVPTRTMFYLYKNDIRIYSYNGIYFKYFED